MLPSASPAREQLVDAVVPMIVTPRPAPAPVAVLPAPARRTRSGPGVVTIDVARVDSSRRVRAVRVLRALGWLPGSSVDPDVSGGAIVVQAASDGRHKIGRLGDIRLPASMRMPAGTGDGPSVFVAALVHRGLLVIHPACTIVRALRRTYGRLIGELDAG